LNFMIAPDWWIARSRGRPVHIDLRSRLIATVAAGGAVLSAAQRLRCGWK
jgi:hypothetical protein